MVGTNISLSPDHLELLESLLASGGFGDATEVVEKALEEMASKESHRIALEQRVSARAERGYADFKAGRFQDISSLAQRAEVFEEVRRMAGLSPSEKRR